MSIKSGTNTQKKVALSKPGKVEQELQNIAEQ